MPHSLCCKSHSAYSKLVIRNFLRNKAVTEPRRHFSGQTVFSGIQPTGVLHYGNYFGAVHSWVNLQTTTDHRLLYCIVDLHAITQEFYPELRSNTLDMTACLLACGVDTKRSILFQQSTVPQHLQMAWILSSLSTVTQLSRLPQFRERSETSKDVSIASLSYPVLQAADVLLYKATLVPVGDDQLHHLQLCRHLARKYNIQTGHEYFAQPNQLRSLMVRVKSLRNPSKKMSKSEPDQRSKVMISDTNDVIKEKIKKAVTDLTSRVTYEPETRPGVANLISIYSAVTGTTPDEICSKYSDVDTGQFKLALVDALVEYFTPIREEYVRLKSDTQYLRKVLEEGKQKAEELAEETMRDVREQAGL